MIRMTSLDPAADSDEAGYTDDNQTTRYVYSYELDALGNLGVRPAAGIKLAETVDAGQRDYGHVRRGREPAFFRPLCVLAASRLSVDVCSTCSSWRPERLTGSCPSVCRLRVWVQVGRNAADGTTERACYFAAVCAQKRKNRLTQRRQGAKTQRSAEIGAAVVG